MAPLTLQNGDLLLFLLREVPRGGTSKVPSRLIPSREGHVDLARYAKVSLQHRLDQKPINLKEDIHNEIQIRAGFTSEL